MNKKFLINTQFIDGGYSTLSNICVVCKSNILGSPVKNWMFEITVPKQNVDIFRLMINEVKTSDSVNYLTN